MADHWNAKLSRRFVLKHDCGTLVTLSDARACLLAHFSTVTRSESIATAIELLVQAADTGTPKDRKAATDQLAIVLAHRKLL